MVWEIILKNLILPSKNWDIGVLFCWLRLKHRLLFVNLSRQLQLKFATKVVGITDTKRWV